MTDSRVKPLLFERYPDLEAKLPWVKLGPMRTPVTRMTGVEAELGLTSLWVKRDDLSAPLYGGNKPRKLEFILADALAKGKRKVITFGGIGSNHTVANAIYCQEVGLKPISGLVDQPLTPHVRKNLLLDLYYGSEFIYAHGYLGLVLKALWKALKTRKMYIMMPGGSIPVGTVGFVNAALELKMQVDGGAMPEPDYLFVACGSTGTAAGLALGLKLAGLKTKVVAVQVADPMFTNLKAVLKLAGKTLKLLRERDPAVPRVEVDNVLFDDEHFGGEYGLPTRECVEAVHLVRKDGLEIETTYTGKAFSCLVSYAREKKLPLGEKTVLFWNTFNTRDFSDVLAKVDYHDLPEKLHWVFEQPLPDFGLDRDAYMGCFEHD
ncbi:MAG: 1-aminocyclopropane-1-carboxylate deaminase/D-cysteine desulfhydrase [Promethearchaeota archaeon]